MDVPCALVGFGWDERLSKAAGDTGIFFGDAGLFIYKKKKIKAKHSNWIIE